MKIKSKKILFWSLFAVLIITGISVNIFSSFCLNSNGNQQTPPIKLETFIHKQDEDKLVVNYHDELPKPKTDLTVSLPIKNTRTFKRIFIWENLKLSFRDLINQITPRFNWSNLKKLIISKQSEFKPNSSSYQLPQMNAEEKDDKSKNNYIIYFIQLSFWKLVCDNKKQINFAFITTFYIYVICEILSERVIFDWTNIFLIWSKYWW